MTNDAGVRGRYVAMVLVSSAALATLAFGVPGLAWGQLFPTEPLGPNLAALLRPRMLLPLAVFALITVLALAAWKGALGARRFAWLAPVLAMLLALAFSLSDGAGLFSLSRDVYVQGYANDAHLFSGPGEVWRDYCSRAGELTGHSRTHPPGPVLFFALTNQLAAFLVPLFEWLGVGAAFTSREVLGFALEGNLAGFLIVFLQSLWLVPLFYLTARFYGERAAVGAVALGLVVPTTTLTAPWIDALFPLLTASVLWLLACALAAERARSRHVGLLLAGFAGGLALAFTFGGAFVLFSLAVIVAVRAWNERDVRGGTAGLAEIAGLVLGGLGAWGLMLATGYDPVERLRGVLGHHYSGVNRERSYAFYLLASPYAFCLSLGPPISLALLAALRPGTRTGTRRSLDPCAWGVVITLAALTLSGLTRGETERLWLPFVPLVVAPAGAVLARSRLSGRALCGVLGLIFATTAIWSV